MTRVAASKGDSRRFGLDLLRAVAVLVVLLGHHLGIPDNVPYAVLRISRLAILGVELFFVLSGFLIGGLLIDQILAGGFRAVSDLGRFWARRWFRTLPLYYLFLVVYQVYDHGDFQLIPARLDFLFFLQNFAWVNPPFFGVAWSLSVEEHFYLLFPLLCFCLLRSGIKPIGALLWTVAVFLLVPLLLKMVGPFHSQWTGFDENLRQVVVYRLDSLMYGVGAAVIFKFFPLVWDRVRRASALGFFLVAGLSVYSYFDLPWIVRSRSVQILFFPITSLGFALLLPYFHALKRPTSGFAKAIAYVSTISYSLYLSHPLVISVVRGALIKTEIFGEPLMIVPLLTGLSLLTGALLFHAWESPFLRLRDRMVPAVSRRGRPDIISGLPCQI